MSDGNFLEVLGIFTRLGCTSFGGPVAHLGYFRAEFVERRKWLDDQTYGDLVGLCQFLPGPASSQIGIALGVLRAGLPGGFAAWLGFTMPSAALMIAVAYGVALLSGGAGGDWLHGLKIVAVAVVAQAVWGMARTLCPDRPRVTMAVLAAVTTLLWPAGIGQVTIIAVAGVIGWLWLRTTPPATEVAAPSVGTPRRSADRPPARTEGLLARVQAMPPATEVAPDRRSADRPPAWTGGVAPSMQTQPYAPIRLSRRLALVCWALFFTLLLGLPLLRTIAGSHALAMVDSFYRSGALVFGGGHVVLPLLQAEVVPSGWVTNDQFIAGYGAAQAMPGPLFTFAAYLGAVQTPAPNGWVGGLLVLGAIFLPAWLLVLGALPFWQTLRHRPDAQAVLRGVNAAVVGILLAALYTPIWTSAIHTAIDFALALVCFALLVFWKLPPWLVVLFAGVIGAMLVAFAIS